MLITAAVWFIVAGGPVAGPSYTLGTLGPFPTQELCEANRKNTGAHMDKGYVGSPFMRGTKCLPMEIVVGQRAAAQKGGE